jgi:hypothetical protein
LDEYASQHGLEPSDHNVAAIKAWLDQNVRGYFSATGVDVAIANLGPRGTNVLTWKPKEAPAPAQQPVQDVLGTLPNGEPRIPLDSTPTAKHSKEQVKDWLARTRAAQPYVRSASSFGSEF